MGSPTRPCRIVRESSEPSSPARPSLPCVSCPMGTAAARLSAFRWMRRSLPSGSSPRAVSRSCRPAWAVPAAILAPPRMSCSARTKIDEKNVKESWLNDNMHNADMDGSDQGMYNGYASTRAYWHDTTYMDNLRTADITDHSVAGSLEDPIQDNTPANNVRGGHSIHTITDETFANDCLNHLEHSGKGGCSDYNLPDCNDGHCCPTGSIDDGYNDCHGNWGRHLMCYCDEKNDCPDGTTDLYV